MPFRPRPIEQAGDAGSMRIGHAFRGTLNLRGIAVEGSRRDEPCRSVRFEGPDRRARVARRRSAWAVRRSKPAAPPSLGLPIWPTGRRHRGVGAGLSDRGRQVRMQWAEALDQPGSRTAAALGMAPRERRSQDPPALGAPGHFRLRPVGLSPEEPRRARLQPPQADAGSRRPLRQKGREHPRRHEARSRSHPDRCVAGSLLGPFVD